MTGSLRAIASVILSAALVWTTAGVLRAQPPNSAAANALFADAVAKESAVRKALAGDMAVPSVLKAVRTVVADYETVVRKYPSSGFSDDALWRAAKLSREAFDAFHDAREKTTAIRLLRQLVNGYPSSRFSPQTSAEMNWLTTNQSVVPATRSARLATSPVQRALSVEPPAPVKAEPAAAPGLADAAPRFADAPLRPTESAGRTTDTPRMMEVSTARAPGALINVKAVRRTVLPTVVRVVVELDAEVSYRDERLENPTRVFVDIPSTRANMALIDQTMRFDGDADIVRQIRIGRHPNNVTRVVLEGAGIASYSIYPLYNPYRLVIDCIRSTPDASAKADAAVPPVTVSLPPAPSVAKPVAVIAPALPAATATTDPVVAAPAVDAARTVSALPVATPPASNTAVPSSTSTATEAEKPAWVETLRRKPTSAKTVTAALPPIPTPNLRSKPVSGTVPLPSAIVAPLPAVADASATSKTTVAPKPAAAVPPATAKVSPREATVAARETVVMPSETVTAREIASSTEPVLARDAVPAMETVALTAPVASAAAPMLSPTATADADDTDAGPELATRSAAAAARSPKAPERNFGGGLSIARQLGLGVSRIVIDAGHGGHDPGAQSHGVSEADLVLDVSLRLEKLLAKVPGIEVLLTRRRDEFIPLQERTAIANREGADLFLSIHANASNTQSAQGIETYFLNFASNRNAAAVAARENATSGQTMGELQDVVKAIAANNKRDESRDFATYVQREMMNSLRGTDKGARDLGVKQAPFVVLVGATMPSVLAEISFITNPQEAKLLKQNAYRQRIAQALFEGVRRYQASLKSTLSVAQQQN